MRTIAYVDGFNLYYRALRGTPHRWLDLRALIENLLNAENVLEEIHYYTAVVSGKQDPDKPKHQRTYLDAIRTVSGLSVHYGNFLEKTIKRPLVGSPPSAPEYVRVRSSEEKGSDVNLASHLLRDGFLNRYDVAVVVTKDTDLCEPIRIVTEEIEKPVGLICPDAKTPERLRKVVSFVRHLTSSRLRAAQFEEVLVTAKGKEIRRPECWAETAKNLDADDDSVEGDSSPAESSLEASSRNRLGSTPDEIARLPPHTLDDAGP